MKTKSTSNHQAEDCRTFRRQTIWTRCVVDRAATYQTATQASAAFHHLLCAAVPPPRALLQMLGVASLTLPMRTTCRRILRKTRLEKTGRAAGLLEAAAGGMMVAANFISADADSGCWRVYPQMTRAPRHTE